MNNVNSTPYLRTSREFPEDLNRLCQEVNKAYVDTANVVNARTIGIYPTTRAAVTGNIYYLEGRQRFQSQREVYIFGAIAAGSSLSIPYVVSGFSEFVKIYGTCLTDGTDLSDDEDARPIPYVSNTPDDDIELRVDTITNDIIITVGSACANILKGLIVLEWISSV
jgi:hypothetical protein